MSEPAIPLVFRYTEADYVAAARALTLSRMRLWLDIPAILLVGGIGIYLWPGAFGKAAIAVAVCFVLVLLTVYYVAPVVVFRRTARFRDEYNVAFSSEGIHFRTTCIDSHLAWTLYSKVFMTSEAYVLCYGPHAFTVIPKRAFASAAQQRTFEELLARYLPTPARI